ncbi:MAG: hypothetical protein JXQ73_26830 [Phycisphaerae bacterium]|nr:hypothetical protein [Phycisphaerae bacterium]
MTPRERVLAAINYQPVDKIPLQIHPSPGGLYEHGPKLLDLIHACGHDFGNVATWTMPEPPAPEDFDPDGRYHAVKTDPWGTTWEYRIFGVWGHPIDWPLNDLTKLDDYRPPEPPPCEGPEFDADRRTAAKHLADGYFLLGGWGSIFETLHSLRRFEDVLMDVALDTPEINRIEDMIVEHVEACAKRSLALGVDAVTFGDDYGTQSALLMSPTDWRRFFRPRYQRLFDLVRRAGKDVFFHCCGKIDPLLQDFRDLGAKTIWPQLPAFDLRNLARQCRDLGLAIQLHPDRGELMQHGTPQDIRDHVHRLIETFDTPSGGSWLYVEIDPGFPYPNVEALFETAMDLRR